MFTGEREFGKTTNSQFLASRETHRPLVAAMETPEISFHVYAFVADVLETLPSACDTLRSRKTTPFPAGRSLVSGALTSGGASSGKPNLVFFFKSVFSVVSQFFVFFQAPQSPYFQPLPSLNLRLPCLTRVLALSLLYHPDYRHIFFKTGPILAD